MKLGSFLGLSAYSDFRLQFYSAMSELRSRDVLHGFKDPTAIDYWAQVADLVVDPVFGVVLCDIAAIAERQRLDGANVSERLAEVTERQTALFRFVGETQSPTAIVSYERLVSEPRFAFETLSEFVVGEVSERVTKKVAHSR